MYLVSVTSTIDTFLQFHAFVEYESVEVAEKAVWHFNPTKYLKSSPAWVRNSWQFCHLFLQVAELQDESNWRNGLKVRLLLNNSVCINSFVHLSNIFPKSATLVYK